MTTTHQYSQLADRALLVLVAVGAGIGASLLPWLAASIVNGNVGEIVWIAVVAGLTAPLVVGLIVRATRPLLSAGLLVVGAAAPALAWFWLPPVYLLSFAIAVTAIGSARYQTGPASTAT